MTGMFHDSRGHMEEQNNREVWYEACETAAGMISQEVPECYRTRTFAGIIGDIKALPPRKARSLIARKKGLGKQYAALYLSQGLDGGRGYQACAAEALATVTAEHGVAVFQDPVLDAGCAVGVTAGILGLDAVTGFDLFTELLDAARLVDSISGKRNFYTVADMTCPWPFRQAFRTVVGGLVCHHLKDQASVGTFFSSANRVLLPGGSLVITLPAGSVSTALQLHNLIRAIETFGFSAVEPFCGMVVSEDDPRSLFWMFLLVLKKTGDHVPAVFIHPDFGFPAYRTPVSREDKGARARITGTQTRSVRHRAFRLIPVDELVMRFGEMPLIFQTIAGDFS